MRVFIDANVIVSAVAARGLCADVMRQVLYHHDLVISEDLLAEVERVLMAKIGVPRDVVFDVLKLLRDGAHLAKPSFAAGLTVGDPKDEALISAAVEGKADLFVTGDHELLGLAGPASLRIISPRMFWELVKDR